MKKENVAILTSGGDAPGMNAFISYFYKLCKPTNINLWKVSFGYQGLISDHIYRLSNSDIIGSEFLGGSVLKTGRSEEFKTSSGFKKAVENLKSKNINTIVVIGGNGSFLGAKKLYGKGLNVIFIPATIDNDLGFTESSLGFDTAVQNNTDVIDKLKQTMLASNKGYIVEVMGRNSGNIALKTAISSSVQDVLIHEFEKSFDDILIKIKKTIENGVESPGIVITENQIDIETLSKYLESNLKKEFRIVSLGHIQRGGAPTANDRMLAFMFAIKTFKKISKYDLEKSGVMAYINSDIKNFDFSEISSKDLKSKINKEFYKLFQFKNL